MEGLGLRFFLGGSAGLSTSGSLRFDGGFLEGTGASNLNYQNESIVDLHILFFKKLISGHSQIFQAQPEI